MKCYALFSLIVSDKFSNSCRVDRSQSTIFACFGGYTQSRNFTIQLTHQI